MIEEKIRTHAKHGNGLLEKEVPHRLGYHVDHTAELATILDGGLDSDMINELYKNNEALAKNAIIDLLKMENRSLTTEEISNSVSKYKFNDNVHGLIKLTIIAKAISDLYREDEIITKTEHVNDYNGKKIELTTEVKLNPLKYGNTYEEVV